jgi:hypothetical protein
MVTTYRARKDIRVMVWAAFWASVRSDLHIIERDWESKKYGYSTKLYIEVLEEQLLVHYQDDLIFMQDNASIHIAHDVRE